MTRDMSTLCALPWTHLSVKTSGILMACCVTNNSFVKKDHILHNHNLGVINKDGVPLDLNNNTLSEGFNSEYVREMRKSMVKGEKPLPCSKCFYEESLGFESKRKWETNYWSNRIDLNKLIEDTEPDGTIPNKIQYLDLRFGNKCQLACVMCNPYNSTGWISDWNKLYPQLEHLALKENYKWTKNPGAGFNWFKKNTKFWNDLSEQIPNLLQIYFVGGEPLIIDEHYDLLQEIIDRGYAKQIKLRYNTNAIEWREGLFDMWSHFESVELGISLDATHERNEYIRYPSKWDIVERNLEILDSQTPDNVEIIFACTLFALNVYHYPDFVKWKLHKNFKKINMWPNQGGGVNFHFLFQPKHFNIKALPEWYKQQVRDKYTDFITWWENNYNLGIKNSSVDYSIWSQDSSTIESMKSIINFMDEEDWSDRLPELKEYLDKVDQLRGLNYKSTFPELVDIFKDVS